MYGVGTESQAPYSTITFTSQPFSAYGLSPSDLLRLFQRLLLCHRLLICSSSASTSEFLMSHLESPTARHLQFDFSNLRRRLQWPSWFPPISLVLSRSTVGAVLCPGLSDCPPAAPGQWRWSCRIGGKVFIVLVVDFKTILEGPGPIFNIIYIYTSCVWMCISIYIYRERERGREASWESV